MPERARAAWFWIDEFGSRIPGATVEVRNAANTAAITDTLYAADDPDTSVLPNPFTSDVNGKAEAYLANAKRAIFRFSKTGYTTQDVPVDFTFPANRFLFRNAWVNTTAYVANDVVTYNGETWVALASSTGVTPVEGASWSKMAAKGAAGSSTASTVSFTPTGAIAATDVQAALQEVDVEKQALSGKGAANGYAGLDSAGDISVGQMPGASAVVATAETTTNTGYVALATAGPAVTVTTGTTALVIVSCLSWSSGVDRTSYMSYAVSGATTSAATDARAFMHISSTASAWQQGSRVHLHTGLTAGSNTFTAQYKSEVGTSTASFQHREIIVIPL